MAKKTQEEKEETLRLSTDLVKKKLNAKFNGVIVKPGQGLAVRRVSTGIRRLDEITQGGYPIGRLTQIAGPDKAGKTTALYTTIAAVQAQYPDETCLMVDTEQTFDPERAEICGVDLDRLDLAQPDDAETAFKIIKEYLLTNCKLIALDSVPMCFPDKVMENDIGEAEVAPVARFLNLELPKLLPFLRRSEAALIFVNQLREKVGGMGGWGDNTQLPGGRMLRHFSSLIIKVQRRQGIKVSDDEVGQEVKAKIEASKVCVPKKECALNIIYKRGFVADEDLERVKKEVRKENLAEEKGRGVVDDEE